MSGWSISVKNIVKKSESLFITKSRKRFSFSNSPIHKIPVRQEAAKKRTISPFLRQVRFRWCRKKVFYNNDEKIWKLFFLGWWCVIKNESRLDKMRWLSHSSVKLRGCMSHMTVWVSSSHLVIINSVEYCKKTQSKNIFFKPNRVQTILVLKYDKNPDVTSIILFTCSEVGKKGNDFTLSAIHQPSVV